MTGARAKLQGSYKKNMELDYLKVEEDGKATWREGGRENVENIKLEYGDFKPAEKVLREASGIENYNFQFKFVNKKDGKVEWSIFGIVSGDGEKLCFLNDKGTGVDIFAKITEDHAAELGG